MAALSTDRIISRSSPPGHAFSPGDAPVRAHARRPGCVTPRIRRHIWRRDRRAAPEGVPGFGGSDVSDSCERTRTPQATVFTELSPSSTRSRSQPRSSRVTMQVLNRPGESRPARPPLSSRPIHLPARLDLRRYLPQGGGAVHHASLTVRDLLRCTGSGSPSMRMGRFAWCDVRPSRGSPKTGDLAEAAGRSGGCVLVLEVVIL